MPERRSRASRTAEMVAYIRHLSHLEPEPGLRNPDDLASIFLAPVTRLLVRPRALWTWLCRTFGRGGMEYHLVRTRHVDAILEAALRDGLEQLVLLGAGYDSRPYRFRAALREVAIFELDLPATQARKKACLARHFGAVPEHVTFVPIDFDRETIPDRLLDAGYDPARRTLFNWEGVSMFLEAEAVDGVLRLVAERSGPGSAIVFDYLLRSVLDGDLTPLGSRRMLKLCQRVGEALSFGLPGEDATASYLAARGLEVVSDLGTEELVERYLPSRDHPVLGALRIVHARRP